MYNIFKIKACFFRHFLDQLLCSLSISQEAWCILSLRAIILLLVAPTFVSCGCFREGHNSGRYSIPVHWRIVLHGLPHDANASILLRLVIDDHVVMSKTVPLVDSEVREDLRLPAGIHTVQAESSGKSNVRFSIRAAHNQEIDLWLYRVVPADPTNESIHYSMAYEVHYDNDTLGGINGVERNLQLLQSTVPLHVAFLREDLGAATSYEDPNGDVPFRIRIDGRLVFDGITRANQTNGNGFAFRVVPGIHNIVLDIPGEAESACAVNLMAETWIGVRFWRNKTNPKLHLIVSNEPISVF
jgi:hypothetical protein